jgi:hypothetical protein
MEIEQTIDLLLSDPTKRAPDFPFEREIRLHQFQTWIYFPDIEIVQMAGRIVATLLLMHHELGIPYTSIRPLPERKIFSVAYAQLLTQPKYQQLFDAVIGEYGGWGQLLFTYTPIQFDDELKKRINAAETVCKMMDSRFRYFAHGGENSKQANIRHSEFYRWKEPGAKLSWKTIRSRWQANRESAAFLYVSERFEFSPAKFWSMGFLSSLADAAADIARIRKFFGYAAFVIDTLREHFPDQFPIQIPNSVKRRRPQTKPLRAHPGSLDS